MQHKSKQGQRELAWRQVDKEKRAPLVCCLTAGLNSYVGSE